jgi:hypothetical protein
MDEINWISASDKLPEPLKDLKFNVSDVVLACDSMGYRSVAQYDYNFKNWLTNDIVLDIRNIIAWQPLPKGVTKSKLKKQKEEQEQSEKNLPTKEIDWEQRRFEIVKSVCSCDRLSPEDAFGYAENIMRLFFENPFRH